MSVQVFLSISWIWNIPERWLENSDQKCRRWLKSAIWIYNTKHKPDEPLSATLKIHNARLLAKHFDNDDFTANRAMEVEQTRAFSKIVFINILRRDWIVFVGWACNLVHCIEWKRSLLDFGTEWKSANCIPRAISDFRGKIGWHHAWSPSP